MILTKIAVLADFENFPKDSFVVNQGFFICAVSVLGDRGECFEDFVCTFVGIRGVLLRISWRS